MLNQTLLKDMFEKADSASKMISCMEGFLTTIKTLDKSEQASFATEFATFMRVFIRYRFEGMKGDQHTVIFDLESSFKAYASHVFYVADISSTPKIKGLAKLVIDYFNEFIPANGNLLSLEEIDQSLKIAQEKYCLINIVTFARPLVILMFGYSNNKFNSSYNPSMNSIAVFSKNKGLLGADYHRTDANYIFNYQLGNALQIGLANNVIDPPIPEGFSDVFHKGFGTHPSKVRPQDWSDIFANTFTMGVMHDTRLEGKNPFKAALGQHFGMFDNYFKSACACGSALGDLGGFGMEVMVNRKSLKDTNAGTRIH